MRQVFTDMRHSVTHVCRQWRQSLKTIAMTSHLTSSWSERLQQETRNAIEQLPVTADGCLHFKHATLGCAYATDDDLCNGRLVLLTKNGGDFYHFAVVDALMQAGWALD